MTEQQFAYWLQGFAELNPNAPTQEQWQSIREHLATVFKKQTPPVAPPKVDAPKMPDLRDIFKPIGERTPPFTPTPYQPYFLSPSPKAGDLIC